MAKTQQVTENEGMVEHIASQMNGQLQLTIENERGIRGSSDEYILGRLAGIYIMAKQMLVVVSPVDREHVFKVLEDTYREHYEEFEKIIENGENE